MKEAVVYIHGKGGNPEESEHYCSLFPDKDVIGFDYKSSLPWEAKSEFESFFKSITNKFDTVSIIANSIGAYYALVSLNTLNIHRAYFISPIVNMEQLILDMMSWANITEKELKEKETIVTSFGETLSYKYLNWVRNNPINWEINTAILYGEKDNLQSIDTINIFSNNVGAKLTIMPNGEHWFHTDRQMAHLDNWIINSKAQKNE